MTRLCQKVKDKTNKQKTEEIISGMVFLIALFCLQCHLLSHIKRKTNVQAIISKNKLKQIAKYKVLHMNIYFLLSDQEMFGLKQESIKNTDGQHHQQNQ